MLVPSSGIVSRVAGAGTGTATSQRAAGVETKQRPTNPDELGGAEDSKKVGRDSSVSEPDDSQAERKDGSSTTDGGQFRTIPPPSVDPRTGRQPFVPTQAPVYGSQAGFVGRSAAAPQFVANERRQDGSPSRASLTAHYDNDNKVPTFSASTLGRGDDNLVPSLVEGRRGEETEEGEGRIDNNFLGSSSYEWRVSGLTDCTLTCGGGLSVLCVFIPTFMRAYMHAHFCSIIYIHTEVYRYMCALVHVCVLCVCVYSRLCEHQRHVSTIHFQEV